jgi:hypothetical protein
VSSAYPSHDADPSDKKGGGHRETAITGKYVTSSLKESEIKNKNGNYERNKK